MCPFFVVILPRLECNFGKVIFNNFVFVKRKFLKYHSKSDFNCGPSQNALLYTVVPDLCLQKLTKISWNRQIDEFFWSQMFSLVTLIAEFYVKTSISIFPKLHWFDGIFHEIAGNSAPELPEFDRKSQKFRQFGVFTKFLSLFQKRHSVNTVLRIAIWVGPVGPRLKTGLDENWWW